MNSYLKELARKELDARSRSKATVSDAILGELSDVQRGFALDKARLKLARCTRRAGKSRSIASEIVVKCATRPKYRVLYLGLTQQQALDIITPPLEEICGKHSVPIEFFYSLKRFKFNNGSSLRVHGVDSADLIDRIRGQAFDMVVFDECAFASNVEKVIDALLPALADTGGSLVMLSSPDKPYGFFYEADRGKYKDMWSRHSWTMYENPLYQKPARDPQFKNRADEEIASVLALRYGGDRQHPAFRREWLGEWFSDPSLLVYPYSRARNVVSEPFDYKSSHVVMGLDLGVKSDNGIVIMRYSSYERKVQILDTWKQSEVLVDDLAAKLQYYVDKYNVEQIIADTGGLGAAVVQELTKRYGNLPISAADKRDKAFYQRVFANDLYAGYIEVLESCEDLLDEWDKLVKDDKGEEVKGLQNHLSDAALYAYRRVYTTHLQNYQKPLSEEDYMLREIMNKVNEVEASDDLGSYYY